MKPPIDCYLVIHEYTCPVCDGDRRLYNEEWQEANHAYDLARNAAPQPGPDLDEDEYYAVLSVAEDAGWQAIRSFWKERGYFLKSRWPPEDYPCPECEGDGIIRKEVNLAEAITAIQEAS